MTRFVHTFRTPSDSIPLRTSAPHGRALYSAPPHPTPPVLSTLLLLLLRPTPSLTTPSSSPPPDSLPPLQFSLSPYSCDAPVPAATALRTTAHAQSSPHYPRLQTIPTSTRGSYPGASAASSSLVSPLSASASRRYRRAGMLWGNAARKRNFPPAALPARRSGCRCSWPLRRLRPRRRRLHLH
eukprot:scaffold40293_cov63-Phaeocystis_antarctica.AAC.2